MDGKFIIKFLNILIIFSVFFLHLAKSINSERDSFLDSGYASKRRQNSGLIPFPRVGRAFQKSWRSRILEQIKRREGLIPFPRVGRSGRQDLGKFPDDIATTWYNTKPSKDFHIYPNLGDQWILSAIRDYKQANEMNDENSISKLSQNQMNDELPYEDGKKDNFEIV